MFTNGILGNNLIYITCLDEKESRKVRKGIQKRKCENRIALKQVTKNEKKLYLKIKTCISFW